MQARACLCQRGQRGLQEPSPQVLLTVGQVTHQSGVRAATTDPTWEQNFRFFVANPNHQSLEVEVRDSRSQKEIGGLRVYLKKLMAAQDMVMERQFPLRTYEQDSALCMTLILRILTPDITPEWLESEMTPAQHVEEEETTSRKRKQPDLPHPSTQTMEDKEEGAGEGTGEKWEEEVKEGEGDEGEASSPAAEGEEKEKRPVASPDSDSVPDIRRRKQTEATSPPSKEEEERGEHGVGRVQVTLRYSVARQQLVVVIHRVINLKALDKEGKKLPDPYVAVHLSRERDSRTKRETAVSKHTLNPVFDTQLTYDVSTSEVPKRRLEMAVRNETGLFSSSPKVLGTALIPLSSMDIKEPVTQWLDLAPEGFATPTTLTYSKAWCLHSSVWTAGPGVCTALCGLQGLVSAQLCVDCRAWCLHSSVWTAGSGVCTALCGLQGLVSAQLCVDCSAWCLHSSVWTAGSEL
ncbi:hypothetical protein ACOMHN_061034 [Nucella lapillus]